MSLRKPLLIFAALLLCAALVVVVATPLAIAAATKWSITRLARPQGLAVAFGSIKAPLFRPIVIRGAHITSLTGKSVLLDIDHAELSLRIAAYFDPSRGRLLRNLSVAGVRGEISRMPGDPDVRQPDWRPWQQLVADNFDVSVQRLTIRSGSATIEVQDATLSANEIESGKFHLNRIALQSSWFTKTFDDIRGATSWQLGRLTVGGLTLMRGLDIDVVTFDLAHLVDNRIGIDANIDLFGGKLRTSLSAENSGGQRIWDMVSSGSEISIGRISDALDFSNRASGSVHAAKFTFRGSTTDLSDSTASLWTEVSGLTWRDRTAEIVMLSASLYSREVQIEQLYVKQRKNELTLTGESELPASAREWPDFRGDISAAIGDLGEFARLFGGSAADFAGQINVNGAITETSKKFRGEIVTSGNALTLFSVPVETLEARAIVDGATATIESGAIRQGATTMRFRGHVDLSDPDIMAIRLLPDQRFTISGATDCVTSVELSGAKPGGPAAPTANELEFRGPLLKAGWQIQFRSLDQPVSPGRSLSFCDESSEEDHPLRLSPIGR